MALPKQGEKKNCENLIVAIPLSKQGNKKKIAIVAMALPKMGGKKNNKIMVAEIWGGIKKKNATSTIFLQHFHNKSQVISYYQFKFEFNTEITFLIQQ